ncbi:kinase-regulated stress-responsive transcription factor skn7 [Tulasnella sp. 417]|nr:kinase-regulated stress-responsive transcription factor skn7 [Tulasnella sp. 417]
MSLTLSPDPPPAGTQHAPAGPPYLQRNIPLAPGTLDNDPGRKPFYVFISSFSVLRDPCAPFLIPPTRQPHPQPTENANMQARATPRTPSVRHQNNLPGRARGEALGYPHVNRVGIQDRRVQGYAPFGNSNVLPSPPPTQPYADVVGLPDDEECSRPAHDNTFIYKVHNMLESGNFGAFIHWNNAGDSIVIPDIQEFKTNVLEDHFGIPVGVATLRFEAIRSHFVGQYTSFVRNLNGYEFKKIDRSTATATYKHKGNMFRKGCRHLLPQIKRVDSQQRKAHQQDQPIGADADDSNSFPTSGASGLSDTQSRIHHLEQENISLASQLDDAKGELDDVKEELSEVKKAMAALESSMAAALQALEKRFQASLSLHSAAPSGAHNSMHKSPPSTLGNVAGVTHGGYLENPGHAGSANMAQSPTTNWGPTGMGTQRIPSASQLPGTRLYSHPHCAPPTTVLPPQNLVQSVQPSPPSSAARLAIDQDFPLSMTSAGQGWPGSCTGAPQPMLIDSEPSGGAVTLNGATPGWGRFTRCSPRQLNHPTMTVQRRQPVGSDIRDPGPSSSQTWLPRR